MTTSIPSGTRPAFDKEILFVWLLYFAMLFLVPVMLAFMFWRAVFRLRRDRVLRARSARSPSGDGLSAAAPVATVRIGEIAPADAGTATEREPPSNAPS